MLGGRLLTNTAVFLGADTGVDAPDVLALGAALPSGPSALRFFRRSSRASAGPAGTWWCQLLPTDISQLQTTYILIHACHGVRGLLRLDQVLVELEACELERRLISTHHWHPRPARPLKLVVRVFVFIPVLARRLVNVHARVLVKLSDFWWWGRHGCAWWMGGRE